MAVYAGREILIKVSTNGLLGASASWVTIGQQRGGGLSRTSETVDATHKDDAGYPSAAITRTPWSVSCDGALNPLDTAWTYLVTSWAAKTKVPVQVDESAIGGETVEGLAIITDLSKEFPESDLVSFTAEFQGDGQLAASP